MGVSVRTIKSVLSKLQKDKKISRENGKRYGNWKVNSKEQKKK